MLVRVTTLESFRRFINGVSSYDTEDKLMESLTGKFTGNEYTRIGTSFHKIVECGDISIHDNDLRIVKIDEFDILMNQIHVDTALRYKAEITGCFHEIRASKTYVVNGVEITITGGADVVLGNTIRDIKTKYSALRSIQDYIDSYQWRFYLDIFDLPEFFYDIFEFQNYKKDLLLYDVSKCPILRHEPIQCLAYSGMSRDIEKLLTQFIEFIEFKKIEHLFK